ncbi:MAG: hypothetical protein ACHBN1_24045 [Heteroscytonema crispum UTEX LB 1556]
MGDGCGGLLTTRLLTTNHQQPTTNPTGEPVTWASVSSRSTRFTTNNQQPTN